MPSIIEVDTIKNKTGTQNTVLSTDGSGNNTLNANTIKDGSATKTLATLSSSAVTLHSDVTAQAGSGFLNKISNSSSSGSDPATAFVAFDNTKVTTSYKFYQIIIDHIVTTTDERHLYLGLSYDNGSNFFSSIYCRADWRRLNETSGGVGQEGPQNVDYHQIGTSFGNDANEGASAIINILGTQCTDTIRFRISSDCVGRQYNDLYRWQFASIGEKTTSQTANYFKIYFSSSSTIAEHDITLYGVS